MIDEHINCIPKEDSLVSKDFSFHQLSWWFFCAKAYNKTVIDNVYNGFVCRGGIIPPKKKILVITGNALVGRSHAIAGGGRIPYGALHADGLLRTKRGCSGHAEVLHIRLYDGNFRSVFSLRYPRIRHAVGAVHHVHVTVVHMGIDEFPHYFVFRGHFKDAPVGSFGDQRVTVRQALRRADEGAVEAVGVQWFHEPGVMRSIRPH